VVKADPRTNDGCWRKADLREKTVVSQTPAPTVEAGFYLGAVPRVPVANANVAAADKAVL
jgi:hypothetical protein